MSGREAECARLEIVNTGQPVSGVQIPPHPPVYKRAPFGCFFITDVVFNPRKKWVHYNREAEQIGKANECAGTNRAKANESTMAICVDFFISSTFAQTSLFLFYFHWKVFSISLTCQYSITQLGTRYPHGLLKQKNSLSYLKQTKDLSYC